MFEDEEYGYVCQGCADEIPIEAAFFDDDGGPEPIGPFCESCYMKHTKEVRERCKDRKTS